MSRECKCANHGCNRVGTSETFIMVPSPGSNYKFYCPDCYNIQHGYSEENSVKRSKVAVHGKTISFESEGNDTHGMRDMLKFGWMRTRDGTAPVEYKSVIYNRISGLSRLFTSIETYGHCGNPSCGNHINVGRIRTASNGGALTAYRMELLRDYIHTIVKESELVMVNNPVKLVKMFGRGINQWAMLIGSNGWAMEHCNWLNLQHKDWIEFRMPKMKTAQQYMHCTRYAWDMVDYLTDCAIAMEHAESEEKRMKIATKTGKMIAKLLKRYMDNRPE